MIGKPLDRIDGPLKVAGSATYAAEYRLDEHGVRRAGRRDDRGGQGRSRSTPTSVESAARRDRRRHRLRALRPQAAAGRRDRSADAGRRGRSPITARPSRSWSPKASRSRATPPRGSWCGMSETPGRYDFAAHTRRGREAAEGDIPPHFAQGDFDAGDGRRAGHVDATYTTPSQNSAAMEPHASTAVWDEDGALTLYGAYQMPTSDTQQLAEALGVSKDKVRIVARYVGGGFGSKLGIAPESVAAAIAAQRTRPPGQGVMARQQVFEATVRRSNTEQRVRLGADAGRASSPRSGTRRSLSNLPSEDYFEPAGHRHALHVRRREPPDHARYRPAEPVAVGLDARAGRGGRDARARRRDGRAGRGARDRSDRAAQAQRSGVDPEKDVPYSSRQLTPASTRARRGSAGTSGRQRRAACRDGDWLIGMGMAAAGRSNMLMQSAAKVSCAPTARATVDTDMTDIGTGSYTILAQIAAEMLGLPIEHVDREARRHRRCPPRRVRADRGARARRDRRCISPARTLRAKIAKALGVDADALTLKDGYAIARQPPRADRRTGRREPAIDGDRHDQARQAGEGDHAGELRRAFLRGRRQCGHRRGPGAADARRVRGRAHPQREDRAVAVPGRDDLRHRRGADRGAGPRHAQRQAREPRSGRISRAGERRRAAARGRVPRGTRHPRQPAPAKGIGELGISGAGAAVANAIYNATGVRVRDFPITLDKLLPPACRTATRAGATGGQFMADSRWISAVSPGRRSTAPNRACWARRSTGSTGRKGHRDRALCLRTCAANTAYAAIVGAPVGQRAGHRRSTPARPRRCPGVIAVIHDDPRMPRGPGQFARDAATRAATPSSITASRSRSSSPRSRRSRARRRGWCASMTEAGADRFDSRAEPVDRSADDRLPAADRRWRPRRRAGRSATWCSTQTYTTPIHFPAALEPHATTAWWEGDRLTVRIEQPGDRRGARRRSPRRWGSTRTRVRVLAPYSSAAASAARPASGPKRSWPRSRRRRSGARSRSRCRGAQTAYARPPPLRHGAAHPHRLRRATAVIAAIAHESVAAQNDEGEFLEPVPFGTLPLYARQGADASRTDLVRVDLPATGAVRAPGEAVGTFAVECAMDELAEQLGHRSDRAAPPQRARGRSASAASPSPPGGCSIATTRARARFGWPDAAAGARIACARANG